MLEDTMVLILAGGLGTRLRVVLPGRPKGLAPIGGHPFLEIQIRLLKRSGARRIGLCLGYGADQIVEALGTGEQLGVTIEYSIEDEQNLLGTAGALKHASRLFTPRALVVNGDTYFDIDYEHLLQRHIEENVPKGALATMALGRVSNASEFGSVVLDHSERWVLEFREKEETGSPPRLFANGGVYVVESALLDRIPTGHACSLEKDVLPGLAGEGPLLAAEAHSKSFYDIGTPQALAEFSRRYAGQVTS